MTAHVSRRAALGSLASLVSLFACGLRAPAEGPPRPELKLTPIVDLVVSAGLSWLVVVEPRRVLASPETVLAASELWSEPRFNSFVARYGVDARSLEELVIAGYRESRVALVRGHLDPANVERKFAARAQVLGRQVTEDRVVKVEGRIGTESARIAIFGPTAAAIELGRSAPLRAAEAFATGRLKKARPALAAEPLASIAKALGDGFPARAFFPGPFDDEWTSGAGGLLRSATAAVIGARFVAAERDVRIEVVLLVDGKFTEPEGAKARLGAAIDRLLSSDLGKLLGCDHPAEALTVDAGTERLRAHVVVHATPFFQGLYAATDASASDIFK